MTPPATKLLSDQAGGFGVRFTFYAVIQIITVLTLLRMSHEIRGNELLRKNAREPGFDRLDLGLITVAALFAISIPIAFATRWAYVCWALAPLVTKRVRDFRQRGTA